jgi:hypothetical protein
VKNSVKISGEREISHVKTTLRSSARQIFVKLLKFGIKKVEWFSFCPEILSGKWKICHFKIFART